MVSDDVDVVEFNPNKSDAESVIQQWLNDNSAATSLDHVTKAYEKSGRVGLAMIHTD